MRFVINRRGLLGLGETGSDRKFALLNHVTMFRNIVTKAAGGHGVVRGQRGFLGLGGVGVGRKLGEVQLE